jgi:small subunit ribosomal protein S20
VIVPRIRSARKRLRQTRAATLRNRRGRSQLRTALKKVHSAATRAEATEAYLKAQQLLDRAGRKNLIHPNAAARQKSRLAKTVAGKK